MGYIFAEWRAARPQSPSLDRAPDATISRNNPNGEPVCRLANSQRLEQNNRKAGATEQFHKFSQDYPDTDISEISFE